MSTYPHDDGEQLGLELGEAHKVQGQSYALAGAPEWRHRAERRVLVLAVTRRPFTSEQVTSEVGLPTGEVGMNKNNAVGALMAECARRGWIRRVGYDKAHRASQHAAVLAVWEGTTAADRAAQRAGVTP